MTRDERFHITLGIIMFLFIIAFIAHDGPPADPTLPITCATEDAPGPCVWDATKEGNHVGTSFTVTTEHGVSHYVYSNGTVADIIAPAAPNN